MRSGHPCRKSPPAADWQAKSEPIVVNGLVYFPTRALRLFDAQLMQQTGTYERVPISGQEKRQERDLGLGSEGWTRGALREAMKLLIVEC
jgi:hypothetical protein